jgi:hypothetical protein
VEKYPVALEMTVNLTIFGLEMIEKMAVFGLEMKNICIFAVEYKPFRHVFKISY